MNRDAWIETLYEAGALQELHNNTIGIEAAHYIETRILYPDQGNEPLVPALGGLPLGLKERVDADLGRFRAYKIEPIFVFSGLDLTRPEDPFRQRKDGAIRNANAWNLYAAHDAQQSVVEFGRSRQDTFLFSKSQLLIDSQGTSRQKTCSAPFKLFLLSAMFHSW